MKKRRLTPVLFVVTLVMFGIHKWGQYEEGRTLREVEQRINRMLSERQVLLNPSFAREVIRPIAIKELRKEGDPPEKPQPISPAA